MPGIDNFIPAVWSARILQNLFKAQVYGSVANRDYEGEIKEFGDRVKINNIGAITVGTYAKNTDMSAAETLTGAQRELVIDQSKYFNFQIDNIDAAQQKPKVMSEAMREAAYALADVSDTYIAGLYTGAASANFIGSDTTPIEFSGAADAYEKLVDISVKLDEANVPKIGRWVIIPAWYHGVLRKDSRFVQAGTDAQNNILFNGLVGRAAGLDIYVSNNVPNAAGEKWKIQAGYAGTLSFAEQIAEVEAYKPEKRFANAVKGLHLYGAKLVRPNTMVVLVANRTFAVPE